MPDGEALGNGINFNQYITEENGNSAAAIFTWPLTSEHVRDQPIQVVIKSSDDGPSQLPGLSI